MGRSGSEIAGTVEHMKKNGIFGVVIFGLIGGLILLLMGAGSFFGKDDEISSDEHIIEDIDAMEYKKQIEGEIRDMCKSFMGVDNVYVCVRVDGSGERVYAKDKQYSSGTDREEYVIIGSGSGAYPLYLGQDLPEILGIGVIIKGNNVSGGKSRLEALISSAYGVPQNRVCVEIN